jgi:hypothetical protein
MIAAPESVVAMPTGTLDLSAKMDNRKISKPITDAIPPRTTKIEASDFKNCLIGGLPRAFYPLSWTVASVRASR